MNKKRSNPNCRINRNWKLPKSYLILENNTWLSNVVCISSTFKTGEGYS